MNLALILAGILANSLSHAQPAAESPAAAAAPLPEGVQAVAAAPAFEPLTLRQKASATVGRVIQPRWILYSAMRAGMDQWDGRPEDWRQGAKGYAGRFGALHALDGVGNAAWFAGAALLREDPRYLRSARTGFLPRTADALKFALLARRDNGKLTFAAARTFSGLGSRILKKTVYFGDPLTGRTALRSTLFYLGTREAFSVIREFLPDLFRKMRRGEDPDTAAPQTSKPD